MPRVRPLGLVSQDTRLFLDPLGISETGINLKGFKFCAFNFRRIFYSRKSISRIFAHRENRETIVLAKRLKEPLE